MADIAELVFGKRPEMEAFDPSASEQLKMGEDELTDLPTHIERDLARFGHLLSGQVQTRNILRGLGYDQSMTNKILLAIFAILVLNGAISIKDIVDKLVDIGKIFG